MAGLAESYGGIIFPDPRNQCLIAKPISLGIYKGQGTNIEFLPVFFRQVTLIVALVRLLLFFCSILRQPPFIAEALSGLAAYYVGRIDTVNVFPVQSLTYLEIIARWGLLFYGFLAGQETDLEALRRPTLESLAIVLIGIPVCYAIAAITIVLSMGVFDLRIIFVGASALSMTSAASVTHLLAGLKLLNAPISQTAVASAIIGDAYSWAALILFIALCNNSALQVAIAAAVVSVCCAAARLAKQRKRGWWFPARGDGKDMSNKQVCWAIVAVMAAALSADAVGMKSVVGAYVFGLFTPRMEILTEKMEYMVMKTIVPLFYCVSGMRAAMALDTDYDAVWRWSPVLAAAATVCRIAAVFAASFWVYQPRHAVALGLLMNAKGFVSLLLLNLAWENAIIGDREFAVSFFAFVLMTAAVAPLLQVFYRPAVKDFALYDHRAIGSLGQHAGDLRVLACIYSVENVSGVISLLRASNATPSSPLYVFILHLVELAHRSSSVLIVPDTRRIGSHGVAAPEQYIRAFDSFQQSSSDVAVEPLTATSPLSTMHEDICGLAEDNRVAFLILPFHPHSRSAAALASPARHQNSAYAAVSRRVLDNAPCSVGIFVDRGASGEPAEWSRITVLFFFGPDDREALAYGWRMARRGGAWLSVVRFVLEEGANELQLLGEVEGDEFEAIEEYARQKRLDSECVAEFRKRTQGSSGVSYREAVLRGGEETATAMRELDRSEKRDLYVVGRGARAVSPLTAGHGEWSDDPELGPIGDILVSPGFSPESSVLVVQRYFGGLPSGGDASRARDDAGDV